MTPEALLNQHPRFIGDRYQRLRQAAEIAAGDPALVGGPPPYDSAGLRAFVAVVCEQRMLDRLSERDADFVSAVMLVDFCGGPAQFAARIEHGLSARPVDAPSVDDAWEVASTLATALHVLVDGLASLHNG